MPLSFQKTIHGTRPLNEGFDKVKSLWKGREEAGQGKGKAFLQKGFFLPSPDPAPPSPKTFGWWGGGAAGVPLHDIIHKNTGKPGNRRFRACLISFVFLMHRRETRGGGPAALPPVSASTFTKVLGGRGEVWRGREPFFRKVPSPSNLTLPQNTASDRPASRGGG